jgi:hypothetical protein
MNTGNDAVSVLRDSARNLQRIASSVTDVELADQIRRIALDCDSDAADLERFISETRPKPGNDPT